MMFDFLSGSLEETIKLVYRDSWVAGFVEGALRRTVSFVRRWNESDHQEVPKDLYARMIHLEEAVMDQVLQLIAAHPDWDDEAVWKAVQWGSIERELEEYAKKSYDSEHD